MSVAPHIAAHTAPADHRILILDFGSQYTQLIARRVREAGVYSEVMAWDADPAAVRAFGAAGVILSGGPESVIEGEVSPRAPAAVFELGVPVLGICYGMQTMAAQLGGAVEASSHREFGHALVTPGGGDRLLRDLADVKQSGAMPALNVWMSHGDRVSRLPPGFCADRQFRQRAAGRHGGRGPALLRPAIPSGGHPHRPGPAHPRALRA